MIRLRRKVDKEAKMVGGKDLIDNLILSEEEIKEEIAQSKKEGYDKSSASKLINLKHARLEPQLLSYLRAHLLISYPDLPLKPLKVTEPSDLEYETYVLDHYSRCLDRIVEQKRIDEV